MNMPATAAAGARRARIGIARLTKMAFDGIDLAPLWQSLMEDVTQDPANTDALLDMSYIAQLSGDPETGATLQSHALVQNVVYRSRSVAKPALRLLAFSAPVDIGGNTPIDFLLDGSDVELITLYVAPQLPLPDPIPDHDVAIVAISDSAETRPMLKQVEELALTWPKPVLNPSSAIQHLDRDRLFELLADVEGVEIPRTERISRQDVADLTLSDVIVRDILPDGAYPLILRPAGTHAGKGLEKIESTEEIIPYLEERPEEAFFVSRYVDYSSADGLFRKYRVVFVDGRPLACHMAVCEDWKVWYLNAAMSDSADKRAEEARFMARFDSEFAARHGAALAEIDRRIGLEYYSIDCAETRDGRMLVFEADNAAIVHDMDPVDLFPYKGPQMRKIFDAFVSMLYKHARLPEARAA
jgi:glutathione synthase/RimK-type ligase-like ATP-grasp enzyme